jgi:RNA polymerase sigma-70 factor (ECF subfamily)
MTDDLVARCRRGDEFAWRELVERYARYVAQIARSFGFAEADAEDIFQEVFLRTWRKLDDIPGDDALRAWIGQVARNLCVDRYRRAVREVPGDDGVIDAAGPGPDVFSELELSLDVHDAMRELPDDCQAVLDAFFFRDRSYVQIADELGIAQGTIASRISRCLGKLRSLVPAPVA